MSDAAHTFGLDDADSKAAEARHVFRTVTGAYPAAVFIVVPVDDIVTAIFNAPMETVGFQNTLGVGLLRRSAGNTIGDIFRVLARFLVNGFSFNGKSLSDMWKIEVVIQLGGNPDFAGFNPAMVRGITKREVGLFAVLEVKADIFKE